MTTTTKQETPDAQAVPAAPAAAAARVSPAPAPAAAVRAPEPKPEKKAAQGPRHSPAMTVDAIATERAMVAGQLAAVDGLVQYQDLQDAYRARLAQLADLEAEGVA